MISISFDVEVADKTTTLRVRAEEQVILRGQEVTGLYTEVYLPPEQLDELLSDLNEARKMVRSNISRVIRHKGKIVKG